MRYRELTNFVPVKEVVRITDAGNPDRALELVGSYVFSREAAAVLEERVLPALSLDAHGTPQAILITGAFGSGKSHLLALLSAIAENAVFSSAIRDPDLAAAAQPMAGQYKVLRLNQLHSTRLAVGDLIYTHLEEEFRKWGIPLAFPGRNEAERDRYPLDLLMRAFSQQYPNQGLLLVVDELVQFLASRPESGLMEDLFFLQWLAEYCAKSRFRLVISLPDDFVRWERDPLFDGRLRRLLERFIQVPLGLAEMKAVISGRMLVKTPEQRALVESHLLHTASGYAAVRDHLTEWVDLFPIHPSFVAAIERINIPSRRGALGILASAVSQIYDTELPQSEPGVISFDDFWRQVSANPSWRTQPAIATLNRMVSTLEGVALAAFPESKTVVQLILAMAVLHLASPQDKDAGASVDALHEGLLLPVEVIEERLAALSAAANDQYLERTASGHYRLNPDRRANPAALIEKAAKEVTLSQLHVSWVLVLGTLLGPTFVAPSFRSAPWLTGEIPWYGRRVGRQVGVLLDGTGKEAPSFTCGICFTSPFANEPIPALDQPGVVVVRTPLSETAVEMVKRALVAWHMAVALAELDSMQSVRQKAMEVIRQEVFASAMLVYGGVERSLMSFLPAEHGIGLGAAIAYAAGVLLSPYFDAQAPEYPRFPEFVAISDYKVAARAAIKALVSPARPSTGTDSPVLQALLLTNEGLLNVHHSPYARYLLEQLAVAGGSLARGSLMTRVDGMEYLAADRFRLEPEWVAVLLAALVKEAQIVVHVPGLEIGWWNFAASGDALDVLLTFRTISLVPVTERGTALELLTVNQAQLIKALLGDERPVPPMELESRFHRYLADLVGSRNPDWVRLLIRRG